ncbi:hypothetical protein [Winogradskyella sp. 3972H.M.0a.05]|uniref:hypothetical protein n=1 Tax=Winogradskyella sp. 3972H.M.0a.05 TaxID=2950277 RepID=UPI003391106C
MTSRKYIIPVVYILSFFILLAVYLVGDLLDIPYKSITGDPAYATKSNPFTGVISNIGILLWATTAAVCLFTGLTLRYVKQSSNDSSFLISSGLITLMLLLDDLFMLHDYAFTKYLNIKQVVTYAFYFAIVALYGLRFWKTIKKNSYVLLAMAFAFFGTSVFCDLFFAERNIEYFWEDSLKFLGIISWSLYFLKRSSKAMKMRLVKAN